MERLRAKGITEHIEVVYRSYQLDPGAPVSDTTPAVDAYAKKFGGQERAAQIINHVTSIAAQDGITFKMNIARRANTILAHRVLHWVLITHGNEAQACAKESLLAAYFTHGSDISQFDTLRQALDSIEIDTAGLDEWLLGGGGETEFLNDLRDAQAREITAVPSFVINDQFIIPGAQDVEVFEQILTKMLSR